MRGAKSLKSWRRRRQKAGSKYSRAQSDEINPNSPKGDYRSGEWTGDPTLVAPVGASIRFQFTTVFPNIPVGHASISDWDSFGSILLCLAFDDPQTSQIEGSAVLIGPGLALAAHHVLDPYFADIQSGRRIAYALSPTQEGLLIWRVAQITVNETDVAILRLDLATPLPESTIRFATLTTRVPAIGEEVLIAGFRSVAEPLSLKDRREFGIQTRLGVGEVSAIYPLGRDRVLMPYPCIEIRCLTIGGMSGGPAFDRHGHLIGILSSSIGDHDEGPSTASLWWPVVGSKIESCWPRAFIPLPTNIMEMAKRGVISVERLDALQIAPDGENLAVDYQPWN